ncbi:MAG: SDR family oxidoreductase [Spirochaetia bacterium]|nr:SDR family oxidoreductase [Spirochaetia bacterium]
MDLLLKGKRAFVTGGMSNLGRAICTSLAKEGVNILFSYSSLMRKSEATSFSQSLEKAYGITAKAVLIDLRDDYSIRSALEKALTDSSLDILINNAGVFTVERITGLTDEQWNDVMDINVKGIWKMVKYTHSYLEKSRGVIVNISSMNASRPGFGGTSHYDASKGAVSAFTRSLAKELSEYGIRVNAVAPGLINSPDLLKNAPELVASYTQRAALHSLVEPEDIAYLVTFLCSSLSKAMTGEIVTAECGYAMM